MFFYERMIVSPMRQITNAAPPQTFASICRDEVLAVSLHLLVIIAYSGICGNIIIIRRSSPVFHFDNKE